MQKVNVREAISRLAAWLPPSPDQAVEFLEATLSAGQVLRLYRRFFPRAYRGSRAPAHVPLLVGHDETRLGYSPREWEFFALVQRRLFPLNLEWMQMVCEGEGEGRLDYITLDVP